MNISAWRIVKLRYASGASTGEGARQFGGRFNSVGVAVVYLGGSLSLAMLEMLVHLDTPQLLDGYVSFEVQFPSSLITIVDTHQLPRNWGSSPASKSAARIGDQWVKQAHSAVLRVPSAIVPSEWNYLINPNHPEFRKIIIGRQQQVRFDSRLIKTHHGK